MPHRDFFFVCLSIVQTSNNNPIYVIYADFFSFVLSWKCLLLCLGQVYLILSVQLAITISVVAVFTFV